MFVTHSFTKLFFLNAATLKGKALQACFNYMKITKFHENPQIQQLSLICVRSLFYNEDPTYLKVVPYFFLLFGQKKTFFSVSAHAQNCFRKNLLKNFSQKHIFFNSMNVTGVTIVTNELYIVLFVLFVENLLLLIMMIFMMFAMSHKRRCKQS